jgi:hypothetical protein
VRVPLTTLLSQALVAYTIEFDNEFEHRMPHRTSRGSTAATRQGPWLVSLVMWSNCMRFVDDDGVTIRELERMARTKTNLDGMRRWGYITIDGGSRSRRPESVLRATAAGLEARKTWQPGLEPYPDGWRASVRRPETLPHFPMVMHRGGFPDGS